MPPAGQRKNFLRNPSKLKKKQDDPSPVHDDLINYGAEREPIHFFSHYPASIIPDPLNELPPRFFIEVEAAAAFAAQFRAKYSIHNPDGPRWYFNHHLIPRDADGRPPSVFSPSFPPMATAPSRGHDPSRHPNRTPSSSPLPTPSSSQIRIQEPPNPRSRKISQGTSDSIEHVENIDSRTPNGHHQFQPKHRVDTDSGVRSGPSPPDRFNNRPRRASMTHGSRPHQTTTPSPLSMSASAIDLQPDIGNIGLPRKLSKRRKGLSGLFGAPEGKASRPSLLRRQSALAPSSTPLSSDQGPFHVLGRLVKRLSVLRKTDNSHSTMQSGYGTDWHHASNLEPSSMHPPTSSQEVHDHIAAHMARTPRISESVSRVPPPSIEISQSPVVGRRRSSESISIHEIRTSGRLTIANPDSPSSGDSTPQGASTPILMPYVPGARSSVPSSKEYLPRSDSPQPMEYVSGGPRVDSEVATKAYMPPSSPPLPDLPPPTPAAALEDLPEVRRSPAPSTVVLPSSPAPAHLRDGTSHVASPASTIVPLPRAEDIALARASMVVNPPTPYTVPTHLEAQNPRPVSNKRPDRSPSNSRETARSKSMRETETYKLVRNPSATMKVHEVIVGMGEQWEVVGATSGIPTSESPKKSKSKLTRDKVLRSSEREQVAPREDRESRRRQEPSGRREESGRRRDRSVHREEYDRRRDRSVHREENGRRRDASAHREESSRRSSTEEGDSRQKRHPSSSRDKASSLQSTQTPISSRRSVKKVSEAEDQRTSRASSANTSASVATLQERERRISGTAGTRPNSELTSAAELSVRAKDAWDKDRLFRPRSMAVGSDGILMVPTPPTIGSESRPSSFISTDLQRFSSIPSEAATVAEISPPNHGSNYTGTYYVDYTQPPSWGSTELPYLRSNSPEDVALNPQHPRKSTASQYNRLPNPLPEPPRIVPYTPAPLPASLVNERPMATWRSS